MIIVSPEFQTIILQKKNKNKNTNDTLNTESIIINAMHSVELLRVTIDSKFNFEEHIYVLCKKSSLQLNVISCLQKYMSKKEKVQ